jgi:uncharacterized protein (DUF488 family)
MPNSSLENQPSESTAIFSIGHSNHDIATFLELLKIHRIEVVADVRTSPFSRYSPQFNREPLTRELRVNHVGYAFLGRELGGRPEGARFYDHEGHVLYDRLADSELFEIGVARLVEGSTRHRVAMLCSEGDPLQCHRHLLIARVLASQDVAVTHIQTDGSVSDYSTTASSAQLQSSLFDTEEVSQWRSPRSVLPSTAPIHFSVA